MTNSVTSEIKKLTPSRSAQVAWLAVIAVFLATYWSVLEGLVRDWWTEPDYGHGFFVPIFALVLLYVRRDMAAPLPDRGSWWGLAFLFLAGALRWYGVYFTALWHTRISIVPCIAGVVLLVGGWRAIRWSWPSLVFLLFMIPLPGRFATGLRDPLQTIATKMSVFVIQTLGIPASALGHQIHLTTEPLEVAAACSGLRMLMLFFAICLGAAFVVRRPLWERLLIVASAIPIAVLSNVVRITLTAILFEMAHKWPDLISAESARWIYHDVTGFLMMPIALLLLWVELLLLDKLLMEPVEGPALSVSLGPGIQQPNLGEKTPKQ